jgi:NADH:ubiquinone oxidoreductase subunit
MALKDTLLRVFTWWNGQTVSLALQTARAGIFVGEDEYGNKYYRRRAR